MISVAVVNNPIYKKLAFKAKELPEVKVVHAAETVAEMEAFLQRQAVNVAIFALEKLGGNPVYDLQRLMGLFYPDLVIVTYTFAKKQLVDKLTALGIRLLPEPVSFDFLKVLISEQVVNQLFPKNTDAGQMNMMKKDAIKARNYTKEELALLQEVISSIDCECPNHLANLTQSLYSFEDYAQACQSQNPKDAEIHAMLYAETAKARTIIDQALKQLCAHEKIDVKNLQVGE